MMIQDAYIVLYVYFKMLHEHKHVFIAAVKLLFYLILGNLVACRSAIETFRGVLIPNVGIIWNLRIDTSLLLWCWLEYTRTQCIQMGA